MSRPREALDQVLRHLPVAAYVGVVVLMLVGGWSLGTRTARDNGWFCSLTDTNTSTVSLPSQPIALHDYERAVKDQNGCATLDIELTVDAGWSPGTAISPVDQPVTIDPGEAIPVRVVASTEDFWLTCGDFTGRRAGNFPTASGDRPACDATIETRCKDGSALVRCEQLGNDADRCLSATGQVTLACSTATVCLDEQGRFVSCD